MGWFWSDAVPQPATVPPRPNGAPSRGPPAGCPMHKKTVDVLSQSSYTSPPSSSAVPPPTQKAQAEDAQQSMLSKLNPLNYMFHNISQAPAPNQTHHLPTDRDASSIPKGSGHGGRWEYPSPQQMYNALLRKGYTDTDVTAVEDMVAVHNFLNEGAWAEIVEWERRFAKGLARGWEISRRGEANAATELRRLESMERAQNRRAEVKDEEPSLVRFQGRPKDMTPRAAMLQVMGWLYPAKFGTEPPFDRHDWYVTRNVDGQQTEVRYVIDYYSGPPEPTGEPVFYLDVRPALSVTGACERMMRWGGDVWYRASGAEAREAPRLGKGWQ